MPEPTTETDGDRAKAAEHERQPDVYVRPRHPVDEPPTYRAQCSCGWTGPERYHGITDADWDRHVAPPDADRAKAAALWQIAIENEMEYGIDAIAAALAAARAETDQLRDAMRALAAKLAGRGQAQLSHPMFAGEGKLLMEIAARVLNLSRMRDLADGGRR